MTPVSFKRKLIFFLGYSSAILILLTLLPFVEAAIADHFAAEVGLPVDPNGRLQIPDDVSRTGQISATTISLIINIFLVAKIALWMALVIGIVRFVSYLIFSTALRKSGQSEISALLRTVMSIVVYIVAFFVIFQSQYPNVQLAPLFTGSTIIGIVVGLALQDTLGNLFAGIALQADQPFQVGDVVSLSNNVTGIVETVSWRGVKIRTFQNKLLIISNAVLGKETIEVAARDELNARLVFFNSLYSQSPARTVQVVRDAVRQVENVSQRKRPIVRIRDLGESGIDWEVKYWCDDYQRYNETDAAIRLRIWYAFKRAGLDFAFPTRTLIQQTSESVETYEDTLATATEQIANVPIFEPLSEAEVATLARSSSRQTFGPGEVIVSEGQPGRSMFVVVRGTVQVTKRIGTDIREIGTLKFNDFFGEMSLLTGEPRSATVLAIEECDVIEIRKAALGPILEANPELADNIAAMIDDRNAKAEAETGELKEKDERARQKKTVLDSLKNFFGLSSKSEPKE